MSRSMLRATDALYVSFLALPFSTAAQRREIRNELAQAYNPYCQTGGGAPASQSELVHKVDELERKKYLHASNALGAPSQYMIGHKGRAFLVRKGLA